MSTNLSLHVPDKELVERIKIYCIKNKTSVSKMFIKLMLEEMKKEKE